MGSRIFATLVALCVVMSAARAQVESPAVPVAPTTAEPAPASAAVPAPVTDDPAAAAEAAPAEPTTRAIDPVDLSAYVDGLVDQAMKRDGIAGVTVAIVDRDGPLLLRGYGIAAQSPKRAVDPAGTLFRIASISKTFTYLLALQQIDAGRYTLDTPVNTLLPEAVRLPENDFGPVLVRHLLTHTAGFEDSAMGHLFVDSVDRVTTNADYLATHRPARVRAPGMHAVYSNYSVALLGVLVAQVAGTDFDTLAERQLFTPMGMAHTTFREPLRSGDPRDAGGRFDGAWSEGFKRGGGRFKPQAFEHIAQIAPAGGASSTAADMGRYMRMLVNGGTLDGREVLTSSAWQRLRADPLFRNAPQVGGFSYGFFRLRAGEVDLLEHGGATSWFHSGMMVAPEPGIGIFVSTNTDTGVRFASQLGPRVLARYFPQARATDPPAAPAGFDASRFAGSYVGERRTYTTAEKMFLANAVTVSAGDDGSLAITSGNDTTRWVPEGGLVFREAEGTGRIVFLEDAAGEVVGYANALGHNVFDRAGPFDVPDNGLPALLLVGVVALFVLTGAWLRRNRRIRDQPSARAAAVWLYLTALLWLVFLVVFGTWLVPSMSMEIESFYRYPETQFRVALWLALLPMVASVVCLLQLWPALRARDWGFWRKLRHLAAVAAFVFGTWLLWHWNLVGWKV